MSYGFLIICTRMFQTYIFQNYRGRTKYLWRAICPGVRFHMHISVSKASEWGESLRKRRRKSILIFIVYEKWKICKNLNVSYLANEPCLHTNPLSLKQNFAVGNQNPPEKYFYYFKVENEFFGVRKITTISKFFFAKFSITKVSAVIRWFRVFFCIDISSRMSSTM